MTATAAAGRVDDLSRPHLGMRVGRPRALSWRVLSRGRGWTSPAPPTAPLLDHRPGLIVRRPCEASAARHAPRAHVADGALVASSSSLRTATAGRGDLHGALALVLDVLRVTGRRVQDEVAPAQLREWRRRPSRGACPPLASRPRMSPPASRHVTLIFLGAAARDVHFHQGAAASRGRGNTVGVTPQLQRSERVARRRGRGLFRMHSAITFTPPRQRQQHHS